MHRRWGSAPRVLVIRRAAAILDRTATLMGRRRSLLMHRRWSPAALLGLLTAGRATLC